MTVYVDDMYRYPMGQFRGMKMSHMVADTDDELHRMAGIIGVARRWFQGDHYDIAISKRQLAIYAGAKEITLRECGLMTGIRRRTGKLGDPETCHEVYRALRDAKEAARNA